MTFPGAGMKVGGALTLNEARARQQWELQVTQQIQAQKLRDALATQQQQEEIVNLEANPSKKNKAKLAGLQHRIARGAALEAACQKLECDAARLKDDFVQFLVDCNEVTCLPVLDDQIEGRDRLAPRYRSLSIVLGAHKDATATFAFKELRIQSDRVVRAWTYLDQLIESRVRDEREAYRAARERARDVELQQEMEEALAAERERRGAGAKKPAKARELSKLRAPAELAGASPTALAIYTWAYGHAMDANHGNWRTAYNDPLNRPLGPSYPATETITFPNGVRHIVSSHPRQRVSGAVAEGVSRLWAGQTLQVPGGPLGTTRYLSGATAPHDAHINLVLEGGNVATGASVLNLHVHIA